MADWGDTPPTFDRAGDAWGSNAGAFAEEGEGGGEQQIELIGSDLRVAGKVGLGRFRRVSDLMNLALGYMTIRDAVVLTRTGDAGGLTLPELRILADDVAVVSAPAEDQAGGGGAGGEGGGFEVEKRRERLVVLTRTHIIEGDVFIQGDRSIMAFVDATDPKFIPMTDVRVRWVADHQLAATYPFALLQRTQILGVGTEGISLGRADRTVADRPAPTGATSDDVATEGLAGES